MDSINKLNNLLMVNKRIRMNDVNKEWTRPVLDTSDQELDTPKPNKTTNAAWTSVAIGVVTKKILQNDAKDEYPFIADGD